MKIPSQEPYDAKLSALLNQARPSPDLPPRFQENVWRRIERKETPGTAPSWMELLAGLLLKPRFAVAAMCAFVAVGVALGSINGAAQVRHDAQERYLAAVAVSVAP